MDRRQAAGFSRVFALDVWAYAVMSNHYHVVLHLDTAQAASWDLHEAVERWHQLCKGSILSQRFVRGETLDSSELARLSEVAETWRSRLADISWFMRCLNESIAREANLEDQCTGRFWEGRFKPQALQDERVLVARMAYVDPNPVRAKMADTPEASGHTSVKRRIEAAGKCRQPEPCFPLPGIHGNPCLSAYLSACRTT